MTDNNPAAGKVPVAIVGSGNIGTDLMFKIIRLSEILEVRAMVGVDPDSDGLARAKRLGIGVTAEGIDGLTSIPGGDQVQFVFDATSAGAHAHNYEVARSIGAQMIDLTPAAIGPFTVPVVNLAGENADALLDVDNVNMVTCGGQATIPVVAALRQVAPVAYAEIVASIASKSAGPGTRANIDEFTETTAHAIEKVGGAGVGKAIIVLNPAEPPLVMRDTVIALVQGDADELTEPLRVSVREMVAKVAEYVPGYRLKHDVQTESVDLPYVPALDGPFRGVRASVFLEVSGAGHYLPEYAGNLDIMTSAALRTAEELVRLRAAREQAVTA